MRVRCDAGGRWACEGGLENPPGMAKTAQRWRAKTSVIQENPDGTPALPMVVAVIPNNSRGPRTDDGSAEG